MNYLRLNEQWLADLKKLYYAGFISLETVVYSLPIKTVFEEFPGLSSDRVSTCLQNLHKAGLLSMEKHPTNLWLREPRNYV
uniref:Uncharacterized protein n=1 Tax=Cyanothece sp. (strain PCC 7425 / ATCC 29141) TaxID=395961 RepID=B8HM84_CYAP4